MEKRNIILKSLIKNKTYDNIECLIHDLVNEDVNIDLKVIEIIVKDIFFMHKEEKINEELFKFYQLLINAIIVSSEFNKLYNPKLIVNGLFELVKVIVLLYKDQSLNYLSGCLNQEIRIVELNKNGLKVKHFAYNKDYKVNDLVYTKSCSPDNLYYVTDTYMTSLNNAISYINYISSGFVYHFEIPIDVIARQSIEKLNAPKIVVVDVWEKIYYFETDFDVYQGMSVEVNIDKEVRVGTVLNYLFFYDEDEYPKLIRPKIIKSKPINKEKREFSQEILSFMYPEETIDSFLKILELKTRKNIFKVFKIFDNVIDLISKNDKKLINTIDELNLYFRPLINFIINNIDLNNYYYTNNEICFSILSYLVELKRRKTNILEFLIDGFIDPLVNIVIVNLYGVLLKCFAYDINFIVGEPVFVSLESETHIGFVHEVKKIKFNDLIKDISVYNSFYIVQIMNIQNLIINRSTMENKVIIARVLENKTIKNALFKNYIPYNGEIIDIDKKTYIIIDEPISVNKDDINIEEFIEVE